MKIAVLFSLWGVGNKTLNFFANNINVSTRSLSGSDLAVIENCKWFVKFGHDIHLFTVHAPNTKPDYWEGIKLYHYEERFIIDDTFDVIINMSEPDVMRGLTTKPLRIVNQYLNDWTYTFAGFDEYVDQYTAPCQMLIDHVTNQVNAPSKDKFVVVPLGCDPLLYTEGLKVPGRVIWTSSACRGANWLCQSWPEIKKAVPNASLRMFYNFAYDGLMDIEPNVTNIIHHTVEMANRVRYIKEMMNRLKPLDVEHVGSVSRVQMIEELNKAEILAYSCDPVAFSEGFSCSLLESCAAGVLPITTSADCLGSIYGGVIPMINPPVQQSLSKWVKLVIKGLKDKEWRNETIKKCKEFASNYTWEQSAKKLESVILNHPKYKKSIL